MWRQIVLVFLAITPLSEDEPQPDFNNQEGDQAWNDSQTLLVDQVGSHLHNDIEVSLEKPLKLKLLELQSLMDSGNNSPTNQTEMFNLLFHNIQDVNVSDLPPNPNYQTYSI